LSNELSGRGIGISGCSGALQGKEILMHIILVVALHSLIIAKNAKIREVYRENRL
jgi:hypothetical protein